MITIGDLHLILNMRKVSLLKSLIEQEYEYIREQGSDSAWDSDDIKLFHEIENTLSSYIDEYYKIIAKNNMK